jgi:SM-20-related protein
MLNYEGFNAAQLKRDPYPYLVLSDAILPQDLSAVVKDFPRIEHGGSIPVSAAESGPAFQAFLAELEGDRFRQAIAEKFDLDLSDYPIMTTVRGMMRSKDGRIHTDSKTKVITVLVYLNEQWPHREGFLRILRNGEDLDDFVEEVPPLAGTMVVFEVTDNCWHGHQPLVGERRSIQMNYLTGDAAKGKHQFFHKLSARIKQGFQK